MRLSVDTKPAVRFRNAQAFAGKQSGVHATELSSIARKVQDIAQGCSGREVLLSYHLDMYIMGECAG